MTMKLKGLLSVAILSGFGSLVTAYAEEDNTPAPEALYPLLLKHGMPECALVHEP